jgi:putative sugar O-methyltransferase
MKSKYLSLRNGLAFYTYSLFGLIFYSSRKMKSPKRISVKMRRNKRSPRVSQHSLLNEKSTSMTDRSDYKRLCTEAVSNEGKFLYFRRHPTLIDIMEHVPKDAAIIYLNELRKSAFFYFYLGLFAKDNTGHPLKSDFKDFGQISPTSTRYAHISEELYRRFGSLDGFNVCEIGAGYGGQAYFISERHHVRSYSIIDLELVVALAKKYLRKKSRKLDLRAIEIGNTVDFIDLVISNYAFSELRREAQEEYFNKVIFKAPRGFFIYNQTTPPEWNSMQPEEFASRIRGSEIFPEQPLTGENNVVVVWGHKRELFSE